MLADHVSDPRADAMQELVCFILLSDSFRQSRGLQGMESLQSGCYNCLQREAMELLAICRPPFQVGCHGAVKHDTWENCEEIAQRAFAWHC